MQAEILIDGVSDKGQRILRAMAEASPVKAVITDRYRGGADILMLWGSRRIDHKAIWERHGANGGRCIGWDLGYWDRTESMRVHIDHQHPTANQLALAVGVRREFVLREDASPDGPVMLVGIGDKSKAAMGPVWKTWEQKALKRIRSAHPLSSVVRRPKVKGQQTIEQALNGCRLVVCLHSNVAVDACIAGVPVWCDDGAAFSLYRKNATPCKGERLEFLRQLAWFNWRPNEAGEAWKFLLRVCAST